MVSDIILVSQVWHLVSFYGIIVVSITNDCFDCLRTSIPTSRMGTGLSTCRIKGTVTRRYLQLMQYCGPDLVVGRTSIVGMSCWRFYTVVMVTISFWYWFLRWNLRLYYSGLVGWWLSPLLEGKTCMIVSKSRAYLGDCKIKHKSCVLHWCLKTRNTVYKRCWHLFNDAIL